MAEVEVTEEDTVDRNNWRRKIVCAPVRVCARACMRACVCTCVMCLQYTIKYLMQADNNDNKKCYPIFHTHQTLW